MISVDIRQPRGIESIAGKHRSTSVEFMWTVAGGTPHGTPSAVGGCQCQVLLTSGVTFFKSRGRIVKSSVAIVVA